MSTSDATPHQPGDPAALPGEPEDDWDDVPITPRTRMPWPTKLLLVAAVAALAFGGGVLADRHGGQSGSSSSGAAGNAAASSFFSRTRADFGGASSSSGGLAGAGVTAGQIAYIKGSTIFVADTTGNIVRVTLPSGLPVTKSVTTTAKALRPGDTVVVRGEQGSDGSVQATSISIGSGSAGLGSAP